MIDTIIQILIGIVTVLSVILTNRQNSKEFDEKLELQIKAIDARLENITEAINRQANITDKVPGLEKAIARLEEQVESLKTVAEQIPFVVDKLNIMEDELVKLKLMMNNVPNKIKE